MMDKSSFLIDFNSPAQKHDPKPLIPVPPQTSLSLIRTNEQCDDPFEVPEAICPDPFENVLKLAFNNSKSERTQDEQSPDNTEENNQESLKCGNLDDQKSSKMDLSDKKPDVTVLPTTDNLLNKVPFDLEKEICRDKIPSDPKNDFKNWSNVVDNNATNSIIAQDSDSQSQITTDFSTEESLKAVIAKRVNRCIQEVLSGSLITNKNGEKHVLKKPQNKRSLSFIGLSTVADKKEVDRLNKSCTDFNDSFNLIYQEFNVPNSSSDSSGISPLSPNTTDDSVEENVEDQVFREAQRLSRTFSKLADSFRRDQESSDSDNDDIMSCKPRWLYTDSSEDEEEKLLKDPALNFRRRSDISVPNSPAPQSNDISDSPALIAYKTRRSFTQLHIHPTQELLKLKRSISVGAQLKEAPVVPIIGTSVPTNINVDDQPMKLKKHNTRDMKKGPLRAVMPVQSMTKEPLPNAGFLLSKKQPSPEARLQKPLYVMGTPNKDNSHLGLTPVASSTPNKADNFLSSSGTTVMLKSAIQVAANKRHSLEGTASNQKRQVELTEVAGRPRSNSVNSSIPQGITGKIAKGGQLIPKSTSSLARPTYNQKNTHNVNVPAKMSTSKVKSSINSRVLAEVKKKSPHQNKVKVAVNTISNLVTGRGKKAANRDKENRVPV